MLVSATEMLKKAKAGHYAVGQFNINNLEWTKAILQTAQRIPEAMHGFTTNRTPGWERALDAHCKFFREHL